MATKNRRGGIDMTVGNPYKLLFQFSLPLLIGNILQQMYNMVDSIIVGNYVGKQALAALTPSFPIIFMLVSFFMGIGMGATIMIAQFFGAHEMDTVEDIIETIYSAFFIIIIPLSVIGFLIAKPVLGLMNMPDDGTFTMAVTYLQLILAGIIGMLGYNVNSGILQGLGDSKTNIYFLALSTILNTLLDLLFTYKMGMGVAGVGIATVIAQAVSWVCGVWYIKKKYPFIRINPFKIKINKKLLKEAARLGFPSGLQQALFSIGILVLMRLITSFGTAFLAGYNGAGKIDSFAFMPIQSITIAVTAFVGQNVGAGFEDRVRAGRRAGLILTVSIALGIGAILYLLREPAIRLFTSDPESIRSGMGYLTSVLPFYSILAVFFTLNAVLRGVGNMTTPLLSSVIGLLVVRVPVAYFLAHMFGSGTIYYSYGIGWFFGMLPPLIVHLRGKWLKKRIQIN